VTARIVLAQVKAFDYTFPDGFPAAAESLVRALLVKNPAER
jgi:hypothetical protein